MKCFPPTHLRYALTLAVALIASQSNAESDWDLVVKPFGNSSSEHSGTNAPTGFLPQAWEDFAIGDVRTVGGNQSIVADAIVTGADTPLGFFNLLFGTAEFGGAGDEILNLSAIAAFNQLTPETVATDPIAQIFLSEVFGLNASAGFFEYSFSGSFEFRNVVYYTPLTEITTGGAVFYAFLFDHSGNVDVLVDGFVIDPALNNSLSVSILDYGDGTLSEFNQATSITGACATGCTFANISSPSWGPTRPDDNAAHGVSWGLVVPPFGFTTTTEQSEYGPMAFITVNELAPRSELPSTGIATYDTVIGGNGAVRAASNEISHGNLDTFSATVDFATAQVTDVALSGSFSSSGSTPSESFNAANTGGPSNINADGTFAAALSGTCSFCNGNLSGQIAGGFASGGAALLAAYGLRATDLTGSQQSIVGSVLATE